ncbi:hypothetical protein K8R03_01975 [Candidatus Kaiserbacteria bacterium]|nr:hypothetical protein [Candidatus Kaiserbacteria bacterium]
MALEDTIRRFGEQFSWEPVVERSESLRPRTNTIVCGMGGSHLGPWIVKRYGSVPTMYIHRDYGLPVLPPTVHADALVILSSYSGGTEEILDAGKEALARGLPIAVVTTGGALLEFAREHALPSVTLPQLGLEPRMAVGLSMLAVAHIMGNTELEAAIRAAGSGVDAAAFETEGRRLGSLLTQKIPVIYASTANTPLAYFWKINFNETSKIPAFCNVFPEMNHNELSGYDVVDSTRPLSTNIHALFLQDVNDHVRIQKRMQVAGEVLEEHGTRVERIPLAGDGFTKAFSSLVLASWTSLQLAQTYGVPNPETPLIAEFKKRILL